MFEGARVSKQFDDAMVVVPTSTDYAQQTQDAKQPAVRAPRMQGNSAVIALMVFADLAALVLAFIIGAALSDPLRAMLTGEAATYGLFGPRSEVLPALMGLTVAVFSFGGLYQRDGWEAEEIKRLVTAVALVALFDAALAFLTNDHFSRIWYLTAWPIAAVTIVGFRMGVRALPAARQALTTHVVMMGSGITASDLIYQLRESRSGPVNLMASLPLGAMPTLSMNDLDAWLAERAEESGIEPRQIQVVITPSADEQGAARALTERLSAMRQPFLVSVSYDGLARSGLRLHKIIGSDVVLAGIAPSQTPWLGQATKRALDIALTGLGMIVIAPIMLVIAALIKLEDGGPIFFSQPRVGKGRSRFQCLKFRSMRVDAKERLEELLENDPIARAEWATHQKLENDPRITRIGKFLRETSLDELPQLLNILKGDMSIVGPRPIVGPEVSSLGSDCTYYESSSFRHYIRCVPGLTGLWQVAGRHRTSLNERIRLDRYYARNQSVWLDIVIISKTFRAVFARQGG